MVVVRIRIGSDETAVPWDEWEERVRDGRVPADALVQIPAVTGDRFVPAETLEAWRSLRREDEARFRRAIVAGGPPVLTALLVGVQVRVWWLVWLRGLGAWIVDHGAVWAPLVLEDGEAWRLLTMGFLHESYDHLFFNMLWLAYAGWNVERALGWRNLGVVYVASVMAGSVASVTMAPWRPSLGASGGVFGLVAACVVFGIARPELLPAVSRRTYGFALLPYLVWAFWNGLQSEGVDNWAHGGGIVAGSILAVLLDPEALERRPRWNVSLRAATGVLVLGAMLLPALAGPRLVRTTTEDVAAWHALKAKNPDAPPPDPPAERSLAWGVPAGWSRGVTQAGDGAFCAPTGSRCFGVSERRRERALDLDALQADWLADVTRVFGDDARVGPVEEIAFAGWPGRRLVVDLPDARLEWRAAVRGRWSVEAVWQAEHAAVDRLAPLRERLMGEVAWGDPPALAEARKNVAIAPESRAARLQLARALADVGEGEAALRDVRAVLAEAPGSEDAWLAAVELAALEGPEAARRTWGDALREVGSPAVVVAVAGALEASGATETARGLLDLAWGRSPGDRTLKRARKARNEPTSLEPERQLPYDVRYDVVTGLPRAEDVVRQWLAEPVDLAAAERRAAALADRDRALVAAVAGGDASSRIAILGRLRDGAGPADAEALARDLDAASKGYPPKWMPGAIAAVVKDSGPGNRTPGE